MKANNRRITYRKDVETIGQFRPGSKFLTRPKILTIQPRLDSQHGHNESERGQYPEVEGVYVISVAARLLSMHPQTLRKYERLGLVQPTRTVGMLRLYSDEDLEKLRLIRYLETNLRLNLAGVEFILTLLERLLEMHERINHQSRLQTMHMLMEREMKRFLSQLNLPFQI